MRSGRENIQKKIFYAENSGLFVRGFEEIFEAFFETNRYLYTQICEYKHLFFEKKPSFGSLKTADYV